MNIFGSILIVVVTTIFTRFIYRKKNKIDINEIQTKAQSEQLDVILKSQAILKELTEPLQVEINQLRQEIDELKPFICRLTDCKNRKK